MILERGEDGVLRTPGGQYALRTHKALRDCLKNGCVIHAPDPDAVENREGWPYNWRTDRGFMERICPHGTGHPDPQQVDWWNRTLPRAEAGAQAVHGCCGCCVGGWIR